MCSLYIQQKAQFNIKHIKNSYKSVKKKKREKNDKRGKQTEIEIGNKYGEYINQEMFNSIGDQGNANQDHMEIFFYNNLIGKNQEV